MERIMIGLLGVVIVLLIIIISISLKNNKIKSNAIGDEDLRKIRSSVNESIEALTRSVKDNITQKNEILANNINKSIEIIYNTVKELNKKMDDFTLMINRSFSDFKLDSNKSNNEIKEDINNKLNISIKEFNINVTNTLREYDSSIKEKLNDFKSSTNEAIKELTMNVNNSLKEIRTDNNTSLEKINESVNEKLTKALDERLQNSFKSVVDGITSVNKAVGEIKGIATDVGSLKNVLTNVKTKGILGEVILGNIIREFLTTSQYDENVATKKNSSERVEYAIKLPGSGNETIYLPIDSKFPYNAYSQILEANDVDEIKETKKKLRSDLLKYAKDVSEKYIDVPNTTDFAVIFLPLEGLYLEALNMGLFEEIQNKYKVNLTGPTTLSAFINSLNMGFKSLMIEKKSSDVFKLLGAVKTEFGKFSDALAKTQKKLGEASNELDNLVGTRTRLLGKKLEDVEALDDASTKILIEE